MTDDVMSEPPVGSVVMDRRGETWERDHLGWFQAAYPKWRFSWTSVCHRFASPEQDVDPDAPDLARLVADVSWLRERVTAEGRIVDNRCAGMWGRIDSLADRVWALEQAAAPVEDDDGLPTPAQVAAARERCPEHGPTCGGASCCCADKHSFAPVEDDEHHPDPAALGFKIAAYVATHQDAGNWSPRRWAYETVQVILNDPGAARDVLAALNAEPSAEVQAVVEAAKEHVAGVVGASLDRLGAAVDRLIAKEATT